MTATMQRFTIELDAHSLDDGFEELILKNYDVKIVDRNGEPWSVMFEGTREQLLIMVKDHWGEHMEISDDELSPVMVG
jgi:hypothetical protein